MLHYNVLYIMEERRVPTTNVTSECNYNKVIAYNFIIMEEGKIKRERERE